jgi:hypothetical protein
LTKTLIVAAQEAITIRLLVLIAAAVASIVTVTTIVAMAIAIEVRPLRVIALAPLRISLAGVNAVPITIVDGDLIDGIVSAVPIIAPVISIASIIPVTSIVSILAPWPLRLCGRARYNSNAYQKRQCQQDSPDFVPEIV